VSLLLLRRIFPLTALIFLALVAESPLLAYPVSVTINVTFSQKLTNGATSAVATTTIDSAAGTGSSATYTGLTVDVVLNGTNCSFGTCGEQITNTGSLTINTNGTITANFSDVNNGTTIDTFAATLVTGLTQSAPSIYSFGSTSFAAPASTATYKFFVLGGGTVGVTGTINAVGLTASPLTGLSASATQNGTAPASQQVSVTSTDTSNPDQAFSATVSPASATCQAAPWLTLTGASGTTNGTTPQTVTANFISTNLSPGTYNACILIDTTTGPGAPISIPVTYTVSQPAIPTPVISSLSPNPVIAGSGQFTLTVNGSGFQPGATVYFNGTALTPTTFVSATQVTATVPAISILAAGSPSITAENSGGGMSAGSALTVNAPAISSLSPNSATAGGISFLLTVNGSNFINGAVVYWNGTALSTSFSGSALLTAVVPASLIASSGSANVTVVNASGSTASGAATFTINAPVIPTISSLSPSSATAAGSGFTLTVNGSSFQNGATVLWNGSALTTVFVNSGQVTATVPATLIASPGSASVTATNPLSGASGAATFTISVPTPTITSLSPTSAAATGPTFTLTVNGTLFFSGATVNWNGSALTTTFVSATQLTAAVPASLIASPGSASITVTNSGGTASTATTFPINIPTPAISSLNPVSATAGGAQFTLTVNGTGYLSGAVVQWNGTALSTTFVNSTQLTATVTAALIATGGNASITVMNAGGNTSTSTAFPVNIPTPAISSLSPNSANAGGAGFTLTVNGASFLSNATVQWNGSNLATTFVSSTQVTAAVSAGLIASAGSASVTVTNTGGTASTAATFSITIPTPSITSLSPNSATAGGAGFTLTVNGTNFLSGALVQWNGTNLATSFVGSTQVMATVPAALIASGGSASITAMNVGGSLSTATAFPINIPTPTISSLNPASATEGGSGFTLTVNGTSFLSGATVSWNGSALVTTFVSSTQLTAAVPAGLIASSGSASITVANAGGSASTSSGFSIIVPTPTISSLTPTSATAGGAGFTLTVNGTNFISGAVVNWNGSALSTTFGSSTQLTATVPAGLITTMGSASITVTNSGGSPSTAATFPINAPSAPSITSLSPISATAGGTQFTLTVNGSNFVSGATVNWNGSALATTFVSSAQLTATVTASLIAAVGSAGITVQNPTGGPSSAAQFPITAPTPTITILNPTSATAGGAGFTLTVNGTSFLAGAVVNWNGQALTTTVVSSTQLTAAVSASFIASGGNASITVTNAGGTPSAAAMFPINIPTPTITSLGPASATEGGSAFTLTVNGTSFLSGATVSWNNTALATTFVSATQLTAAVPANLIAGAGNMNITVTNAGGTASAATTFAVNVPTPTISGLSPSTMNAGGAAFTLTVNGTNFLSGATVSWNGTALTTTFVSATQLTAAVPASLITNTGSANITAANAGGTASTAATFTIGVPTPTITSLSPASAAATGPAFTLTVNGTNFLSGAVVTWNSTALTTTFVSSTQVTAAVPMNLIASPGSANITATNSGGSASTVTTLPINIPTPTISSLNPTSANAGGSDFMLTVNGTGFLSGATVQWNGTGLTTTFVSNTQLTATVMAALIASGGSASVTVANSGGNTSTATSFSITIPTPTITSLNPASTPAGGAAFTLTVNGTNFLSGAVVNWNGTALTTTFVNSTQLTAAVSASLIASGGSAGVTVTNTGGSASTATSFSITVPTPTITSLNPAATGAGGPAFTLTVNGTNFLSGAVVQWNGTGLATTVVSSTQLSASVSAALIATVGSANVTVMNSGGSPSAAVAFPINAVTTPTISSVSPTSVTAGGATFVLTVNGTGFASGATISWNGSALLTAFVSSTQLTGVVPSTLIAAPGTGSITVANTVGSASSAVQVTIAVPVPTITSLSPASATAGGAAFTLTVNGTLFFNSSTVQWNGTALTTTVVSATQLTAAVPASLIASAGSASVTVANSGSLVSTQSPFTINPPGPVLTTLSPTSATVGGAAFTLTVTGSNFLSGDTVQWNGTGLSTVFVSATQLTATVPASLIASASTASVTVTDVNGNVSAAVSFSVSAPVPAITSLNPASATAGGAAFTLTVTGSNFVSGSTVQWNSTALTTTFLGAAQLSASVPASLIASAGSASVTVSNPGGTNSTATTFAINAPATPTLTSLSPDQSTAGGGAFILTVNGAGFVPTSTVQWNNSALPTTFVSGTQVTASVPASLIASAGVSNVTVITTGVAPSAALVFTTLALAITSLSPDAVTPGGPAFSLIVNGAGFVSGSTVQWNGTALTTSFFNPAQLSATVSANLIATAGTASITVANPGGPTTSPATFSISGLTVTSLSPGSAVAGSAAFTLSAFGTGFASGSTVQWNGTALTTTFVSSTQLTAAVPASLLASAGTANVSVTGGGSTASNSIAFPINALTITTLSPAAGTAGSPAFVLAVNGAGFVSGATVQWNGSPLTTTFVSAGQVLAAVPASLVSAAGTASIAVTAGDPVTSNSLSFPIAGTTLTITTSSLPGGTVGAAYSQSLSASGGTPPYNNWAVGSGALPPGLTLDASAGTISGIPNSAAGSPYNFSVLVKDSTGAVAAAVSLSIAVSQPAALTIITANPLQPGTVGVPYSQTFAATAGTPPYVSWAVTAGALPPGMSFTQASGVNTALLSGTPTTDGPYSFTIQVTDSVGATASIPFSLTIDPANTITIYSSGIVNSASYLGGSVAPGELVTIFGTGMGPVTLANLQLDNAGNVATTLAGVQVLFDGRAAPLIYVSSTQLSAVVPYEVSGEASTQVQVTYQGQTSNTVTVPVANGAPGIYTLNASGSGGGAVLNLDGTVNSADNPAQPGSYVFVYATGEGQTNPPGVDGALNGFPAPIPSQIVTATIGGVNTYVEYAGGVAGLVAGVIQVNLQIPQGVTTGNNVPLLINIGGGTTQAGVTIAIQGAGGTPASRQAH
jgi:uncharacterized protein (TIGR03437 family)